MLTLFFLFFQLHSFLCTHHKFQPKFSGAKSLKMFRCTKWSIHFILLRRSLGLAPICTWPSAPGSQPPPWNLSPSIILVGLFCLCPPVEAHVSCTSCLPLSWVILLYQWSMCSTSFLKKGVLGNKLLRAFIQHSHFIQSLAEQSILDYK